MIGQHPRGEAMRLILVAMVAHSRPMRVSEIAAAVDLDPRLTEGPVATLERSGFVERVGVAPRQGQPGRAALLRQPTTSGLLVVRMPRLPERPDQLKIAAALAVTPNQTARQLTGSNCPDDRARLSTKLQVMRRRGMVELSSRTGRPETWAWKLVQ